MVDVQFWEYPEERRLDFETDIADFILADLGSPSEAAVDL